MKVLIFVLFLLAGCSVDSSNEVDVYGSPDIAIKALKSDGSQVSGGIDPGEVVTLTASGTSDDFLYGGTENLSYLWTQIDGTPCFLFGEEGDIERSFTVPANGNELVFQVKVSNGKALAKKTISLFINKTIIPPEINNFTGETNIFINFSNTTGEIPFTVSGDPSAILTVTGTSSNVDLVPSDDSHIIIRGEGNNRTVEIILEGSVSATALITLTVDDGFGNTDNETRVVNAIAF